MSETFTQRRHNDLVTGRAWMSESFTGARENAGSRARFADESAESSRRGVLV
jgi:hypothetical protein